MAISFNLINQGILTPGTFVEFDTTRAQQGPSLRPYRVLMVGPSLATGTMAGGSFKQITSASQAREFYGPGSILAGMARTYLTENKINELWCYNVRDAADSVKATGTIIFSGKATAPGVIEYTFNGVRVSYGVDTDETAALVAKGFTDAINANVDLEITATVSTATVTITAKNAGEAANGSRMARTETLYPPGITSTFVGLGSGNRGGTNGAKNPAGFDAIGVIGEERFDLICNPFIDTGNMLKWIAELEDRWGPLRQNDGHMITGFEGLFSQVRDFADTLNSEHITVIDSIGVDGANKWMSNLTAVLARELQNDPARPLQSVPLRAITPPPTSAERSQGERNTLLGKGITTVRTGPGGVVLERVRTTKKTNAFGEADLSLADLNTKATLSYIRYDFRTRFVGKFARHKLANDGTRFGPGQSVLTPRTAKAEIVSMFADWEELGLVEGATQFENDLIVERNATDPNRLDIQMPPDLINQLRVGAAQIQFLL